MHQASPLLGILLLIPERSSIFLLRVLNALSQSFPFERFFVCFSSSDPLESSELLELLESLELVSFLDLLAPFLSIFIAHEINSSKVFVGLVISDFAKPFNDVPFRNQALRLL